jgi:hypothetical protein
MGLYVYFFETNFVNCFLGEMNEEDAMRNNIVINGCEIAWHTVPLVVTPLIRP